MAKVNSQSDLPRDRILFQGGQIFHGTLIFGPANKGTANARIEVGSYGYDRATIHGGAGNGIRLDRLEYFDVRNLNVQGLGRKEGNKDGRGIFLTGWKNLTIDQVFVTGFQRAGGIPRLLFRASPGRR